jgi:hypothetical protein
LRQGNLALIRQRLGEHLPSLLNRHTDQYALEKTLRDLPAACVLILDHGMGGGANHYREKQVRDMLARGQTILLWQFIPLTLRFQLCILTPDGQSARHTIQAEAAWTMLAECGRVGALVVNSVVSWPEPGEIPEKLRQFLDNPAIRVVLPIHDFFYVCPSHFLLDYQGVYCDIPTREACQQCLPKIHDALTGLYRHRDIPRWRKGWENVLQKADDVVFFSDNTRRLFLRAYPQLSARETRVQPHDMTYLSGHYHYPVTEKTLRVAMVGEIGEHKGGKIFQELARVARLQKLDMDFILIGTLACEKTVSGIMTTGTYAREDLPGLLCRHRIHLCLMLSIWPETFSYVTHELIRLQVPLFSFDIGAQGDATRQYPLGLVHPVCDGATLLPVLLAFKDCLDRQFAGHGDPASTANSP